MDEQHQPRGHDADHPSLPAADPWPDLPLDDLAQERARLVSEREAAKARIAAAKQRAVARDAEVRTALHAELLVSKESLNELERQHDVAIAMVREAAQAEVERILAEARQRVARHAGGAASPEQKRVNNVE